MAKAHLPKADDSAEKAYAAAAEGAPVEFPSKAKRTVKPPRAKSEAASVPIPPFVDAAVPALPEFNTETLKASLPKTEPITSAPPAPEPVPEPIIAPEAPLIAPEAPVIAATPLETPAPISTPTTAPVPNPSISHSKDQTMNAQTNDFTATGTETFGGLKNVLTDVKSKAKAAFDKGTSSIGEATDFAKGNVEAVVESGKIYAAGLKDLGSTYVTESKSAFEAMTADAKELAAQKTPVDFFKLQGELAKKNFESAVAFGTKSNEAWLKLVGDMFAPLSGRVTLAVDKIKTAA